ncbi:MerR family transcriptional regulator [Desulfuromonas sp. CSMB_57]|jgi:DNA-binding transcriptional MerR regulator|uniref:MerR family transcriptional regulator n=1 Tax=Desulfuromonas sp. CSMB_57 TaxID=2807629 RepID=UPI001CD2CAAB|nr:MerR family transcriptional regulator [Desulfuromonas sp. CSMB_57]
MDVPIPDKLYFKIGEVAQLAGVKPHVLRYWESEFQTISPAKSQGRQRLYRRQDVELVLRLKELLYQQGYTIAGAKKLLGRRGSARRDPAAEAQAAKTDRQLLGEIRDDLLRLRQSFSVSRSEDPLK